MPRSGKKTILNTTTAEIIVKLIDAYREKQAKNGLVKRMKSRAEVIEDAFLWYLESEGELEKLLKEFGYQDKVIQSIKQRLKREHGVPPIT